MTLSGILNMARAGMNVQQIAIQTASQNISNATSAGYSRQRVDTATTMPTVFTYGSVGTGVDVVGISRARDALLDTSYRNTASSSSNADVTSSALSQIEGVFGEPSETGLSAAMDAFWQGWSDLSADPTNSAAKSVVREAGNNVAATLNNFAGQIDQLDQQNRQTLGNDVSEVNSLSTQIAQINKQITGAESNGNEAPDLRDQRDRLLDNLTKLTGGQVVMRSNGTAAVYVGSRMVVDGANTTPLVYNNTQPPTVGYQGGANPLMGIGGSIGAELDISATRIPGVMDKLDTLAKGIVQSVNAIHSAGQVFTGTPPVASPAGNFFDVTTPPPAGTDPRLTARGIRLAATMVNGAAVAAAGATATGPGDNTTALSLANLRSSTVTLTSASGATTTAALNDFFGGLVGDLATDTKQASDESTVQTTLTTQAQTRRDSVSGVSTDEELVAVIEHQHAYQAAARLISVVNDMTQTLIDLGR